MPEAASVSISSHVSCQSALCLNADVVHAPNFQISLDKSDDTGEVKA